MRLAMTGILADAIVSSAAVLRPPKHPRHRLFRIGERCFGVLAADLAFWNSGQNASFIWPSFGSGQLPVSLSVCWS